MNLQQNTRKREHGESCLVLGSTVRWQSRHESKLLGLYSLSGKTSYLKISWSLEASRFGFKLFKSLWNLAGTSVALLPRCLSYFRAIRPLQHPISRLRDFRRFGSKTSCRLVYRGPELQCQFNYTKRKSSTAYFIILYSFIIDHSHVDVHSHHIVADVMGLNRHQDPFSISDKLSDYNISKPRDLYYKIVRSLWNVTDTSATLLPMCLSNFKAMRTFNRRSLTYDTLRDVTIRRLLGYWKGAHYQQWWHN